MSRWRTLLKRDPKTSFKSCKRRKERVRNSERLPRVVKSESNLWRPNIRITLRRPVNIRWKKNSFPKKQPSKPRAIPKRSLVLSKPRRRKRHKTKRPKSSSSPRSWKMPSLARMSSSSRRFRLPKCCRSRKALQRTLVPRKKSELLIPYFESHDMMLSQLNYVLTLKGIDFCLFHSRKSFPDRLSNEQD